MLEAQKLGGDAVVNVFHDKGGIFGRHYLTGTAIKYTNAVSGTTEAANNSGLLKK